MLRQHNREAEVAAGEDARLEEGSLQQVPAASTVRVCGQSGRREGEIERTRRPLATHARAEGQCPQRGRNAAAL